MTNVSILVSAVAIKSPLLYNPIHWLLDKSFRIELLFHQTWPYRLLFQIYFHFCTPSSALTVSSTLAAQWLQLIPSIENCCFIFLPPIDVVYIHIDLGYSYIRSYLLVAFVPVVSKSHWYLLESKWLLLLDPQSSLQSFLHRYGKKIFRRTANCFHLRDSWMINEFFPSCSVQITSFYQTTQQSFDRCWFPIHRIS